MLFRSHLVELACVAILSTSTLARPPIIDQGWDYFITDPSGTWMGFEPGTTLPLGFFGTYNGQLSDPLLLPPLLPLRGRPIGPIPPGANPNFYVGPLNETARLGAHRVTDPRLLAQQLHDTIVRRNADVVFSAVGDTQTIPIEIVSLSLQSVEFVPITFGGGMFFSPFEIEVSLDPAAPSPVGTMSITLTSEIGGTLTSILPVNFLSTFHALDPLVVPTHTYLTGQLILEGEGLWSTVPTPGALMLAGIAGFSATKRRR